MTARRRKADGSGNLFVGRTRIRHQHAQDAEVYSVKTQVPSHFPKTIRYFLVETNDSLVRTNIEENKKYGNYDVILVSDAGHFVSLERPVEFNRDLSTWLQYLSHLGGRLSHDATD